MNDYFNRLFNFNNWANQIVCCYLSDHQIYDDDCIKLISHVLRAQANWYLRIISQQNDLPVWDSLHLSEVLSQLDENGSLWLEYIRTLDPNHLDKVVAYKNMGGKPFQGTVQDIITHVVNHGTHHRGQIIRRIRELGHVPPNTDFINYSRIFSVDGIG